VKRISVFMTVGVLLVAMTAAVAVAHEFINCDGGSCNGDEHDNVIEGTEKRDRIEAEAGNDEVEALGSPEGKTDKVYGQGGNDDIFSGRDDDYVSGGSGDDDIFDEAGPYGGNPRDKDTVLGGGDDDEIDVVDGDVRDNVDCGSGTDTVRFDRFSNDRHDKIANNCETKIRVEPASANSATADSETVSAQQYGEETTETSS
jgi:hypothetical protein